MFAKRNCGCPRFPGTGRSRLLIADFLYLPRLLSSGQARLSDYRTDILGVIGFTAFVILFLLCVEWLGGLF